MNSARQGVLYGLASYLLWGLFPLYFRLLEESSALEILFHRLLWSLPVCLVIIVVIRAGAQLREILRTPRRVAMLGGAATALAVNSGVYVYAVNSGQVLEASLGYFINPLVTVALGVLVLHERLRPAQWVAVSLGAASVVVVTVDYGRPPWIALLLALSFAIYGLVKKHVGGDVGALTGLATETLVLAPIAGAGLIFFTATGEQTFTMDPPWQALLLASGGITVVTPLLLFAAAARRIPLTTIGLLQYLTPVLQMMTGVLLFHERMSTVRWIGFGLIWLALLVFSVDNLRSRRPVPAPERELVTDGSSR